MLQDFLFMAAARNERKIKTFLAPLRQQSSAKLQQIWAAFFSREETILNQK
jgi:hypothetical protein